MNSVQKRDREKIFKTIFKTRSYFSKHKLLFTLATQTVDRAVLCSPLIEFTNENSSNSSIEKKL